MADPERFTPKSKPVTYIGPLVELYNWRNRGQFHKIYEIVKLKKIRASITKNVRNFGAC